jgi:copper homeostasis protein
MSFTFHRAFDMTRDPFQALESLVALGADRILTSGQARSVPEGVELIGKLNDAGGNRIIVMPGAGIRAENVDAVLRETGVREIHFTAFARGESPMRYRNPAPLMGATRIPGEYELLLTDPEEVRRIMEAARGA